MRKRTFRSIAVSAALALVISSSVASPAAAFHPDTTHFAPACAPGAFDCVASVAWGTTDGAGGTPGLPLGVSLEVFKQDALGYVQVEIKRVPPTGGLADYDISAVLNESTEITLVIRFAPTFTPAIPVAAAYIKNWTWNASAREMTIIAMSRRSSWATSGCAAEDATADMAAMFLMAIDDAAPPPGSDATGDFLGKFAGGWISTNAQCFGVPYYQAPSVKFDIGAPHFTVGPPKVVNTGFFRVLVPYPVISDLWGLTPDSLTAGSLNVTVAGEPRGVNLTKLTGRAPLPDGWIFESTTAVTFSTPTVAITPAAPAPVPAAPVVPPPDDGGAPTAPESVAAGPLVREGPVRMPLSGALAVPVTVKGAGASVLFPAGTALTTASGRTFSGIVQAPFRSADPTGGRLVSATTLLATGGPERTNEILLSRPARFTLPVPAGEKALDHQAVFVENGKLTFLAGTLTGDGIAVDVDRLTDRHTTYGLMKVARPPAAIVTREVPTEAGLHARWAGQSAVVDLVPGQLADATVRLLNTGDRPWIRGQLDKQVTLGTVDDSAYRRGLIAAPLWGTDRLATSEEGFVLPGEAGTFVVRLRAPSIAGTYRVYVRPVVDGVAWLEDEGIYVEFVVR